MALFEDHQNETKVADALVEAVAVGKKFVESFAELVTEILKAERD